MRDVSGKGVCHWTQIIDSFQSLSSYNLFQVSLNSYYPKHLHKACGMASFDALWIEHIFKSNKFVVQEWIHMIYI